MDTTALENIGLTQNEAKIYILLNKQNTKTVGELVKNIEIHRSRIYDALERLIKKGLVNFVTINKVKHYSALPPEKLLDLLETKKEKIQEIIPNLKQLQQKQETNQRIQAYQGINGIKILLKETLNAKEYVVFGAPQESIKILSKTYWKNYNQKLNEQKITTKMIFDENLRNWSKQLKKINPTTKIKYLEKQFDNLTETFILNDKTIIIAWSELPLGILITDKSIAKSYKQFFNMLWNQAKE
jgi:HTH-type transcriptional regulator, sugar sensing transcriptional regulator